MIGHLLVAIVGHVAVGHQLHQVDAVHFIVATLAESSRKTDIRSIVGADRLQVSEEQSQTGELHKVTASE